MKVVSSIFLLSSLTFGFVEANDTYDLVLGDFNKVKKENSSVDIFKTKVLDMLTLHSKYISNKEEIKSTLKTLSYGETPLTIYQKLDNKYLEYKYINHNKKVSLLSCYIDSNIFKFTHISALLDLIISYDDKKLYGNILNISYDKIKKEYYFRQIKYLLNHPNKKSLNFLKTKMMDKKISIFDFNSINDLDDDDFDIFEQLVEKGVIPNLYELNSFFQLYTNTQIKNIAPTFYDQINSVIKKYLENNKNDIYKNHLITFMDQGSSAFYISLDIYIDLSVSEYFYYLASQKTNIDDIKILNRFLSDLDISKTSQKNINVYSFYISYQDKYNRYIESTAKDKIGMNILKQKHKSFIDNYLKYSININKIVSLKNKKLEFKPTSLSRKSAPYSEHIRVYLSFTNNHTEDINELKYRVIFRDKENKKIFSKVYTDEQKIKSKLSNKMDTFWFFENDEFESEQEYDKLLPYYIKNDIKIDVEFIYAIFDDGSKVIF